MCVALLAQVGEAAKRRRQPGSGSPPALTPDGLPNIQAASAIALDPRTGAEYYAKNPDEIRFIASTTKVFVALLVRRLGIDLEAATEITRVDRDYARGGARTRLPVFHSFRNIDLLRAMLVSSDNRAPTALGRAVHLDPNEMVAKLDQLAEELGLRRTTFTDPSGLRGNQSTAREMAIALAAAMADPVLADILATREVAVTATHRRAKPILYRNTNLALHDPRYQVTGGKTGYTEAAGYCLVVSARLAGRDLMMAFLGTSGELTRFADFYRFAGWFVAGGERRLRAASIGDSLTGRGALPWVVAGPR